MDSALMLARKGMQGESQKIPFVLEQTSASP